MTNLNSYIKPDGTEIKVGQLITSYFAGVWKVVDILDRSNHTYTAGNVTHTMEPLVTLEKVANSLEGIQLRLTKKHEVKSCSIGYCRPLNDVIKAYEILLADLKSLT